MNWSERISEFVTLWVVIDPLGTLPVFLAVTAGLAASERRKAALFAVLISFGVLLFFVFAGHWLLRAMDVSIDMLGAGVALGLVWLAGRWWKRW